MNILVGGCRRMDGWMGR